MGFRISTAAAIVALAILGAAGGAAASNGNFWTDPAGDSKSAADLTRIVVASDDAGNLTFTLAYGNRSAGLTDDDQVQLWLDVDQQASTGDEAGFDYVLVLEKRGAFVKHATTNGLEDTPNATLIGSTDGSFVKMNRSELGNTAKFNFYTVTIAKSDQSTDYAPDATDRVFVYSLTAPRPSKASVVFAPKTPKAGTSFLATVALVELEDGTKMLGLQGGVSCTSTLNGKPIRATVIPAACVWKLPKSAKGKRLVIRITVSNNGSKKTFGPWKFKVR